MKSENSFVKKLDDLREEFEKLMDDHFDLVRLKCPMFRRRIPYRRSMMVNRFGARATSQDVIKKGLWTWNSYYCRNFVGTYIGHWYAGTKTPTAGTEAEAYTHKVQKPSKQGPGSTGWILTGDILNNPAVEYGRLAYYQASRLSGWLWSYGRKELNEQRWNRQAGTSHETRAQLLTPQKADALRPAGASAGSNWFPQRPAAINHHRGRYFLLYFRQLLNCRQKRLARPFPADKLRIYSENFLFIWAVIV